MATQAERRTTTRGAIVRAAFEAFSEQETLEVPLEAIAERAGVTKGSIHYHFRNRAGLLAAVAIWAFLEIEKRVAEAPASSHKATPAATYVHALLTEQAAPVGRVLFSIGDELERSGGLDEIDPYQYLRTKLGELGVAGSVDVVAAAVLHLGRRLAYGLSEATEIDDMLTALGEGGRLP